MNERIDQLSERHNDVCQNLAVKTELCQRMQIEIDDLKDEISVYKQKEESKEDVASILKKNCSAMNLVSADEVKSIKKMNLSLRQKIQQLEGKHKRLREIATKKEEHYENKLREY